MEVLDVPEIAVKIPSETDLILAGINSGDLIRLGLTIEERTQLPLTDDDLEYIAGNRENFSGKLQERYGIAKAEAQKQVEDWNLADSADHNTESERRKAS